MITFRLGTLYTAEIDGDTLACLELSAFFRGEASVDDLDIDKEQATEWYINKIIDDSSRDDYRSEYQMAEDEMVESYAKTLGELIKFRSEHLAPHYPFVISDGGKLTRRPLNGLTSISFSYLSLQFFRAWKRGYIEFEGPDEGTIEASKREFQDRFEKIFEYIAGYAVSGRMSGVPFMTSDCRSSARLHSLLERVCQKISSGRVRPYSDWNDLQKAANDGGVDCLIQVGEPGMPGDSFLMLVGATVQQANIKGKIIGRDERAFFDTFFSAKPAAFQSVLVRPHDAHPLTLMKCVEQDCLLFSYDEVWKGMAKSIRNGDIPIGIKRLDARTRKLLTGFRDAVFIYDYEEHRVGAA